MKRLFAVVASALLLSSLHLFAQSVDDQYVQIYNEIQDADSLEATQPAEALTKYTGAQTALQRFQRVNPGWNPKVVDFRLEYLSSKITILTAQTVPAKNAVQPTNAQPVMPAAAVAPVVPKPAPVPVPPLPPVNPLQQQVTQLQNEIRLMQGEKSTLEAKLREALAARPASTDPKELAKAQEQIRSLQKENDLLQVTLSQQRTKAESLATSTALEDLKKELAATKQQLAEQSARADKLAQENTSLQTRMKELAANDEAVTNLRSENEVLKKLTQVKPGPAPQPTIVTTNNPEMERQLAEARAQIAALQSDKEVWRLEKIALQNRVKELAQQQQSAPASTPVWTEESTRVKQLERERDDLQKKLEAAQKELYGRKGKAAAARVDELNSQLDVLRARLGVYEAHPVPMTAEELALLNRPEASPRDPRASMKSARELPPGTTQMIAEAQRDFAANQLDSAEQKYLEVLRRDDRNVNTLANLAAIQLEKGNVDEAEKNIKAALALAPDDVYCLTILGNLKYREEKYDDALDALSHAAKLDPQNAEIQNFLGLTLSQKGLRTQAENAFRRAIVLNPNYGSAQNNLAVFYLTQKPPSVALAKFHYEKALAAGFPHNPELEKALENKGEAEK